MAVVELLISAADKASAKAALPRVREIVEQNTDVAAIADTNSSGGTSVNGIKLAPNTPKTLHRGDVIVLGSCHVHVK